MMGNILHSRRFFPAWGNFSPVNIYAVIFSPKEFFTGNYYILLVIGRRAYVENSFVDAGNDGRVASPWNYVR